MVKSIQLCKIGILSRTNQGPLYIYILKVFEKYFCSILEKMFMTNLINSINFSWTLHNLEKS